MGDDLTVEILKQIRDGVGQTNARLESFKADVNERLDSLRTGFNERLDQTNERLDQTNHRLERVEHGLNDLGGFMKHIALDQTRHERFHAEHVSLLEHDVADLKERVRRVEDRQGSERHET